MTRSNDGHIHQERSLLRATAEAELARAVLSPVFPPVLRARYEADRATARSQELRKLGNFGPVVYSVVVLVIHGFVNPEPNVWAFLTQILLFPGIIFFAVRRYARPETPPLKREGMVLGLCCLVASGTILDIVTSPTDIATMNMFMMTASVIGCMFFTRMTPLQALLFVVYSCLCLAAASLGRSDIPSQVRFFPLSSLLVSTIFALFALRELDGALRRNYLHGLLQSFRIQDLADENRSLDLLSTTDSLTGAFNRRGFEKILAKLTPSTTGGHFLLLVDLDHFKQLNDRFGHPAGDAGLRQAVTTMRALLSPLDSVARIGGDEFAILLVDSSVDAARRLAERVCERIVERGFEMDGRRHQLSVTIGAAECAPDAEAKQWIAAADAALYHAKRSGRGRVVWASAAGTGASEEASGLAA